MKKYLVSWTEYHDAEVEANNEEEAKENAQALNPHQTLREIPEDCFEIDLFEVDK